MSNTTVTPSALNGYSPITLDDLTRGARIKVPTPQAPVPSMPPLPTLARLPEELGRDACPWLDAYNEYSRRWSPRAFDGFHEACGLFVLSTVAARRVSTEFGKTRYTNLYIALVGRTSVWAKSSTADIATQMIAYAGLKHLLAPDDSTPQALISDMAGTLPKDYADKSALDQNRIASRMVFAAQRGWYYDEFGQKLSAMMREGGPMSDYRGLLRRFDDCRDEYEVVTLGRGAETLQYPYLTLLANMTPVDMAPHARKHGALWGDGFFARFGFVVPPANMRPGSDPFPQGKRVPPAALVQQLVAWNSRLGVPDAPIVERNGKYEVLHEPLPVTTIFLSEDAREAFYRYDTALRDLVMGQENHDLDGNYTRLSEKALRISMLLASISGSQVIEIKHWARAQQITERWRENLHSLMDQVQVTTEVSKESQLQDKVVSVLGQLGASTPNGLRMNHLRSYSTEELTNILDKLERAGIVRSEPAKRGGAKKYSLTGEDE